MHDVTMLRERLALLRALRGAGWARVTTLSVALAVQALLPAATAVTMGVLVGRLLRPGPGDTAWWPLGLFAGILLAGHAMDAVIEPLSYLIAARVDGVQRVAVASMAAAAPTLDALEDPAVRDLIRLAAATPENWTERGPGEGAVGQLSVLARYLGAAGAAVVLASYAWWMVPVLVVPALLGQGLRRRRVLRFSRTWAAGAAEGRRADYWKRVVMSPAEGKEQRVYGFGDWAVDQVLAAVHVMFDPMWEIGRRSGSIELISTALMAVPLGIVYTAVALGVVHGRATVAVETAVLAAGLAMYTAVNGAYDIVVIEGAQPGQRAFRELRGRMSTVDEDRSTVDCPVWTEPPRVELTGLRFQYPGADRPVLDGLDLCVAPGELLAIVGLNGAGKSTLIKLLAGLYRPTAGRITADGVDLRDLGPAAWREHLSVVWQDFTRYHLSARDNVALGHPSVPLDPAAIEAAVAEAGLDEVLARLPAGLDTPLARDRTGGVDLSGGQWQRVALARALYKVHTGARLLVLDEPTAHLDVRSELELFDRLVGRAGQLSIVLISHRLSTVRRADRIALLADGRITESGSHDELMAAGGVYASMFRIQADRFNRGYDDRVEEGELA